MAKKRRGRRTRAATGGRQDERAHRASTNKNNTKGGSASRTKATDLKYNPKLWEAHKYIIINYFNDSLCGAVLSGEITEPEIEPKLAIALLTDMSRGGTPPVPPLLDAAYWASESEEELREIAFAREGNSAFDMFVESKIKTKKKKPAKKTKAAAATPDQADSSADDGKDHDDEDQSQDFVTASKLAWAALETFRTELDEFREANPVVDFIKHQKLVAQINNSLDSATGVHEFNIFPIHIRYKMYAEINTKIYSFLNKFIGRESKHLKQGIAIGDGKALYQRCNIKQSKPSATSGQAVLKKMISVKQLPGQEYSAYYQYVQDICNQYEEATGGMKIDENLVRLALTERIIDFYKPVMDNISTNDLTQSVVTPLIGEGSIYEAMTQYEITHQKEFRKLRKKPAKTSSEQANSAQQRPSNRSKKTELGPNGKPYTYTCEWCAKFRPGKPTGHKTEDCYIKKDLANVTCDVCGQKGHSARFCQSGRKGRANQADEDNQSVKSNRSSRSHTLKRYVERADDELNSAEAMKALKKAHKKNKKSGRKVLYRIVELSDSDSE